MGIIQRQGLKGTLATALGLVLGLISLLWIQPRFLSTEEIGLTRVLYNFSALVAVFIPLGIGNATTKYFPSFRNSNNGHHGFLGIILLFVITGFIVIGTILYLTKGYFIEKYSKQSAIFIEYFYWVFPLALVISLNMVLNIYCYSSIMLSTIPALLNDVFVRFLLIIFILLYYFGFTDRNQFIITFFFIYVIQFILILFYVLKKDKPSLKIDFNHFRKYQSEILKFGFFMSFVAFASLGIKMIDTLVLAKYSLNFVGIYTIASFIPNVIEIPALALERITGSVVSNNLKDSNYKEVSRIYKLSVLYLLIISGLLFLGILTNIKFLLNFLPSDYAGGLNVVYIIGFGALFNAMAGASTPIIFNSNSYIKGGLVLLSLVVINLILNITLIPPYGMNGAALATGISAIIYTFMRWYLVWKEYRIHPFNGKVFALFCLIIILFLGSFLLPQLKSDIGNIILRSSLIILVYGTFIWTFNIAPELKELVQTKLKANT